MFRETVDIMDAIFAVALIETSMQGDVAILDIDLNIYAMYPENPTESYDKLIRVILRKLGLFDILEKEITKLYEKENKEPGNDTLLTDNSIQKKFETKQDVIANKDICDEQDIYEEGQHKEKNFTNECPIGTVQQVNEDQTVNVFETDHKQHTFSTQHAETKAFINKFRFKPNLQAKDDNSVDKNSLGNENVSATTSSDMCNIFGTEDDNNFNFEL